MGDLHIEVPHSPVYGMKPVSFPSPKKHQQDLSTRGYPLQTKWTFWFDKKELVPPVVPTHGGVTDWQEQQQATTHYRDQLQRIGHFETIDEFTKLYAFLAQPSKVPTKSSNYHMFRHEIVPMWESYPQGGCWMIKIKKNPELLDRLWEQLVFATICEEFQEPNVVGIVLSIRAREDVLSVWNRDSNNQRAKAAIGERFKEILHLHPQVVIQYKHNKLSIKDGSTFRNAKNYVVQDDHPSNNNVHNNNQRYVEAQ